MFAFYHSALERSHVTVQQSSSSRFCALQIKFVKKKKVAVSCAELCTTLLTAARTELADVSAQKTRHWDNCLMLASTERRLQWFMHCSSWQSKCSAFKMSLSLFLFLKRSSHPFTLRFCNKMVNLCELKSASNDWQCLLGMILCGPVLLEHCKRMLISFTIAKVIQCTGILSLNIPILTSHSCFLHINIYLW